MSVNTVSDPSAAVPGQLPQTPRAAGPAQAAWVKFALSRIGRLVVSLWVLITATFFMIHLVPGDPVAAALGDSATGQLIAERRHQLGLDLPIGIQYWHYVRGILSGNFGSSIVSDEPVIDILKVRFPNTLELAIPAFALVVLIATAIGLFAAIATRYGNSSTRRVFVGVTALLNSIPDFVFGTLLIVVFVIWLEVLPAAGKGPLSTFILPTIALIIGPIASLSRIARVEALRVLDTEYVRAARSRHLPWWRLYLRHVLPNMLTASLTLGGMIFSGLIGGTVLIENTFNWPGVGTLITQSVLLKDYPLVQGVLLILGALVLIITTAVDVALGALDPRTRIAGRLA